jgi:hypothetical protein
VPGLVDGSLGFGGEESAGASFLCRDGTTWTTDKDGIILDLLAGEITAVTGKDPGVHYERLREKFGTSYYTRVDAPATPAEKAALGQAVTGGGDGDGDGRRSDRREADEAPGNGAAIGGLKVASANGWFAARPSGRRTSTRSTRRAWSAPTTSPRSSARRARSWRARWRSRQGPAAGLLGTDARSFCATAMVAWTDEYGWRFAEVLEMRSRWR